MYSGIRLHVSYILSYRDHTKKDNNRESFDKTLSIKQENRQPSCIWSNNVWCIILTVTTSDGVNINQKTDTKNVQQSKAILHNSHKQFAVIKTAIILNSSILISSIKYAANYFHLPFRPPVKPIHLKS